MTTKDEIDNYLNQLRVLLLENLNKAQISVNVLEYINLILEKLSELGFGSGLP